MRFSFEQLGCPSKGLAVGNAGALSRRRVAESVPSNLEALELANCFFELCSSLSAFHRLLGRQDLGLRGARLLESDSPPFSTSVADPGGCEGELRVKKWAAGQPCFRNRLALGCRLWGSLSPVSPGGSGFRAFTGSWSWGDRMSSGSSCYNHRQRKELTGRRACRLDPQNPAVPDASAARCAEQRDVRPHEKRPRCPATNLLQPCLPLSREF